MPAAGRLTKGHVALCWRVQATSRRHAEEQSLGYGSGAVGLRLAPVYQRLARAQFSLLMHILFLIKRCLGIQLGPR